MLPALIIGIFCAAAMTLVLAVFNRAPTKSRCPGCGDETKILLLPPILRRNTLVHLRWCPQCDWQGLGRNGPEWIPGRRLAHGSGFHWGDGGFQADFGFKFRHVERAEEQPPHHPSGFRFVEDPGPALSPPQHPSGFRFSRQPEKPAVGPPVFRWAEEREGAGFQFKDANAARRRKKGFNWRGVA